MNAYLHLRKKIRKKRGLYKRDGEIPVTLVTVLPSPQTERVDRDICIVSKWLSSAAQMSAVAHLPGGPTALPLTTFTVFPHR